MWVARVDEGFVFGDLSPASVETLKGVPMLLESADIRVRERLLPETCDAAADEEHWRRHAVPELERLFLSRAQLVRRDLATLRKMPKSDHKLLLIPDGHAAAWLAACNGARLALYVMHDLDAEAMAPEAFVKATRKQQEALLRIHLLAEIQSVLLGDFDLDPSGPFEEFVIE
jgi:hypothetical protein